jgi:Ca2+-binding EF-hand superfamily protein
LSPAEFASGLTSGGAPQGQPDAPSQPGDLFRRLDRNGDGKVEIDEVPEPRRERFREAMKQADANSDGAIDKDEFAKVQQQLFGQAGAGRPNPGSRPAGPPNGPMPSEGPAGRLPLLFGVLDTDGDRRLSASEIEHAAEALKKLDKDGDGFVDLAELFPQRPPAGAPGGNLEAMLQRWKAADTDGDGKLSEEEAPQGLKQNFKRLDANSDGQLDEQELRQMFSRMRDRARESEASRETPSEKASPGSKDSKPAEAEEQKPATEKPAAAEEKKPAEADEKEKPAADADKPAKP